MSDTSQELVPVKTPREFVASVMPGRINKRVFPSFDVDKPVGKKLLFKMLQSPGESLESALNTDLRIVAYTFQNAHFVDDKTGEEVDTVMTKLLTHDGKIYVTHSGPVYDMVLAASEYLHMPSEKTPWICKPVQRKIRGSFSMFTLEFPT